MDNHSPLGGSWGDFQPAVELALCGISVAPGEESKGNVSSDPRDPDLLIRRRALISGQKLRRGTRTQQGILLVVGTGGD